MVVALVSSLILVSGSSAYANIFQFGPFPNFGFNQFIPSNSMIGYGGMMGSGMLGSNLDGFEYRDSSSYPNEQFIGSTMMGSMMQVMMGGADSSTGAGNWNMSCTNVVDRLDNEEITDIQVIIGNYNFHSKILTIKAGSTVTWINMDFVGHNIESGTHDDEENQGNDVEFESPMLGHMETYRYTPSLNQENMYTIAIHIHIWKER